MDQLRIQERCSGSTRARIRTSHCERHASSDCAEFSKGGHKIGGQKHIAAYLVAVGNKLALSLGVAERGLRAGLRATGLVRARDARLANDAEDLDLRELARLGRRRLRRGEAKERGTRTREDLTPAWTRGAVSLYTIPQGDCIRLPDATASHIRHAPQIQGVNRAPTATMFAASAAERRAHREVDSSSMSGDSVRTAGRETRPTWAAGEKATAAAAAVASICAIAVRMQISPEVARAIYGDA